MRRSKQLRLTAAECEALSQSPEGSSSLTQPLGRNQGSRDAHRVSVGGKRRATDTASPTTSEADPHCSAAMAKGNESKREVELLETLFVRDSLVDKEEDSSADADDEPERARKRPRYSESPGDLDEETPQGQRSENSCADGSLEPEANDMEIDALPDARFGLLGTRPVVVPRGNIQQLPDEVLSEIFAVLPAEDIFQSLTLVCHRFHRIISDPKFIPWKKLYHKYVKSEPEAQMVMKAILKRFRLSPEQNKFPLGFLKCVISAKSRHHWDPTVIHQCLTSHILFPRASACLALWLPELSGPNAGPRYIWAMFATLALLCGAVCDMQDVVNCVKKPNSTLSLADIMEILYCIATVLLAMQDEKIQISNRFHYNIFYVLYMLENTKGGVTIIKPDHYMPTYEVDPERSKYELPLTTEQQKIVTYTVVPREIVKVIGFAGSGKTFTMIRYTEKWCNFRFLYLVLNKTIADQAAQMFPPNVTCKTIHSLAFEEVGKHYSKKLNTNSMDFYSGVYNVLPCEDHHQRLLRTKIILATLEAYFASADETITSDHLPLTCKNFKGQLVFSQKCKINLETAVNQAKDIWENMKSLEPTKCVAYQMTPDGYLKLWQLQKPTISRYDIIILDEAEDCTPAIMDIILSQSCAIMLVGDPHQQIYSFRAPVSAFTRAQPTKTFYLTKSFRFGTEIAYIASTLLDVLKKPRGHKLVGNSERGDISGAGPTGKITHLSRCDLTVFDDAVKLTSGDKPAKIHILGGLHEFGLKMIFDVWKLFHPELKLRVKDPFIERFANKTIADLKTYVLESENKRVEVMIAIVEKYKDRLPELLKRILQCHMPSPYNADHILGTVHKVKGLEFDTVRLTDDFMNTICITFMQETFERIPIFPANTTREGEWNLLYIAVTCARKRLIVPKFLVQVVTLAQEHYLRPLLTSEVFRGTEIPCSGQGCYNVISGDTVLTMKKMPFIYSDGTKEPDHFLCDQCVQEHLVLTGLTLDSHAECATDDDQTLDIPKTVNHLFEHF